jgi:glucose/sorbosone dehydrogenase
MRRCIWVSALVAGFIASCGSSTAATLSSIGQFDQPIYVTSAPQDPARLLIVEREGRLVEAGPGGTKVLADFSGLVSCCESERGLHSIAPAPDFASSGRFYATYTGTVAAGGAEGDVHIDSFRIEPGGQAVREPILSVGHVAHPNHNGGQLQFGPDGHLYVSLGDGGGSGDPDGNAQNIETLLGKIIRIDPRPGQAPAYAVPVGNPFASGPGRDELWAYGLRNPWRFSFDRASGDMVIADVGQDALEEIDFAPSTGGLVGGGGLNYGWNCREGSIVFSGAPGGCGSSGFAEPVFDYPHEDPGGDGLHGCSVIGGYVVRDQSVPELYGRYVYTDYCSNEIRSLKLPATATGQAGDDRAEGISVEKPTSFGEDSCGRVYITSGLGPVYRLEGAAPAVCPRPEAVLVSSRKTIRLHLRLRARRSGAARVRLTARVSPCRGQAGTALQLNRGGKRLRVKRLDRRCVARFRLRLGGRATFRALLRSDTVLRSRRLTVGPSHSGRFGSGSGPSARSPR